MYKMEQQGYMRSDEAWMYCRRTAVMSPEIVEIGEDSKSFNTVTNSNSVSICCEDVYVGVGKDDLDLVKWVLEHYSSPSASCRVILVHVYPPITHIPTPVGMLLRSQLPQDQARFYSQQENNKKRTLLQKYIRLCQEAKVTADTMLIESNSTAKAILDLIPVLNITRLVMGTKLSLPSRWLKRITGKGEYVRKNAPEYCQVTVVFGGKNGWQEMAAAAAADSPTSHARTWRHFETNLLDCVCFSRKSD
uniref:Uncharacterized protein n=2 Tax=Kalanchoe fedtschenkoi TaxID=63787 RepID=A0A7N0VEF6_KALFE